MSFFPLKKIPFSSATSLSNQFAAKNNSVIENIEEKELFFMILLSLKFFEGVLTNIKNLLFVFNKWKLYKTTLDSFLLKSIMFPVLTGTSYENMSTNCIL